jgi:hypothetical protein
LVLLPADWPASPLTVIKDPEPKFTVVSRLQNGRRQVRHR